MTGTDLGPPNGPGVVAALRSTKGSLIAADDDRTVVHQTGGLELVKPFPITPIAPTSTETMDPEPAEPIIETFMATVDGSCQPTGADPDLNAAWLPMVEQLVARVLAFAAESGVVLRDPISVTTSLTPIEHVVDDPHLDDADHQPDDGVGLVAIVADHHGPRLALEPVELSWATPMTPLVVDTATVERFAAGALAHQQVAAERIVVFPQFGQLHAGPTQPSDAATEPGDTGGIRHLMVLRAGTAPVTTASR